MKKKSQMKMGESMVIIIIFLFLIVFGLVFYVRYKIIDVEKAAKENAELIAIQTVQKIQFLPELQCSVEGTINYNCIDILKLVSFSELSDDKLGVYEAMFPKTKISVKQIYPEGYEWVVYGKEYLLDDQHYFSIPFALYNATEKQHYFGYVEIMVFI